MNGGGDPGLHEQKLRHIVRGQNACTAWSVKGLPPLPVPCGNWMIRQLAELECAIDPSTPVDCKIRENHSAIPLFTIVFPPKDRNKGSLFTGVASKLT
jgi:hypothetical protein